MSDANPNARLEAFSDGIFSIAATLLILEIKVPSAETVHSVGDLWLALCQLWPSLFAFALSFIVIFIGWVNSSAGFKLIHKSSPHFTYANGLLLFVVVLFPFPTALIAEYLRTDYAQPAVFLYNALCVLSSIAWIICVICQKPLARNAHALRAIEHGLRLCWAGLIVYLFILGLGFWHPLASLWVNAGLWVVWLIAGIMVPMKAEKAEGEA